MTSEISQAPTESNPTIPFQIKSSLELYRKRLGLVRPLIALGLTFIVLFRFGFVSWLIMMILLTVGFTVGFYLVTRRTFTVLEDGIEYRDVFGCRQKVLYADIEAVKYFPHFYDGGFGLTTRLSVAIKNAQHPITLQGFYWPEAEIAKVPALLEYKKVAVETHEDTVDFMSIAQKYPAYASYMERHPVKLALIAMAIIIPVVFIVAVWISFN